MATSRSKLVNCYTGLDIGKHTGPTKGPYKELLEATGGPTGAASGGTKTDTADATKGFNDNFKI